jgi:hypothetical protein
MDVQGMRNDPHRHRFKRQLIRKQAPTRRDFSQPLPKCKLSPRDAPAFLRVRHAPSLLSHNKYQWQCMFNNILFYLSVIEDIEPAIIITIIYLK